MKVCETHEIKLFCKDYVERAEIMFILATISCALVIMSLVSFLLMFLGTNRFFVQWEVGSSSFILGI